MPGKLFVLDLPEDLYESVQQMAEQSQRPVERVVVESLRLLFLPPTLPVDMASSLAALAGYTDAQLWAVVYHRLAWPQAQRLHELSGKRPYARLTDEEQRELDHLLALNDNAMLLRSEALRLLHQRGYDLTSYLQRGA